MIQTTFLVMFLNMCRMATEQHNFKFPNFSMEFVFYVFADCMSGLVAASVASYPVSQPLCCWVLVAHAHATMITLSVSWTEQGLVCLVIMLSCQQQRHAHTHTTWSLNSPWPEEQSHGQKGRGGKEGGEEQTRVDETPAAPIQTPVSSLFGNQPFVFL